MATAPPIAPGLQRKLRKVLDTRSEAPEISNSLATLSTFYTDNKASSRRHLRSTIENEALKVNEDFLSAAQGVINALDAVQADLDQVSKCCERMTSSVLENKSSTSGLLLETDRLQKSLETSQIRSHLLGTFLQQYQLSPAESEALQSDTITDTFFTALEHVQSIHTNCKSLLRTHHQRAGLELLDSMASLQESAYEKLCRWVQTECRTLSDIDSPEVDPTLQKAVNSLRSRHVLYKYCAEEVAVARQTSLFQRFIRALTQGNRPIEMHAPDPWRYANDILAWVHTSLASEREFLLLLFGNNDSEDTNDNNNNNPGSLHRGALPGDGVDGGIDRQSSSTSTQKNSPTLSQLLDSIFEGICRPLRVRIEQVLMATPPPILCFRLSELLTFYLQTVDGIISHSSHLSDTLRACRAMSMRTFHDNLKHKGDKLVKYPPPPPPDLSLPLQLAEAGALVEELIQSYESSLTTPRPISQKNMEKKEEEAHKGEYIDRERDNNPIDMDKILSAILDPLILAAERSAEALNPHASARLDDGSHLDPTEQCIYMLNCIYALQRPLSGHACAEQRMEALQRAAQDEVCKLADIEVERILSLSGLSEILSHVAGQHNNDNTGDVVAPASLSSSLPLHRIAAAMQNFFGSLTDPAALAEFKKLQAPLLKAEAVRRSLFALADAYAVIYDVVYSDGSGYSKEEARQLIKHTPEQVKIVLGIV